MGTQEEYLERCRQLWRDAIETRFGDAPPRYAEWSGGRDIIAAITPFLGDGLNHAHLPTGGGQDFRAVEYAGERGFLAFTVGHRVRYIGKPRRLAFHYIKADAAQSYLRVELEKVEDTGVYDGARVRMQEELVEIEPGNYLDRGVWDRGGIIDDYGDEVPLPSEAKLICRFSSGSFFLVSRGSLWNGTSKTYDGEHDRMSDEAIRGLIEEGIRKRAQRI